MTVDTPDPTLMITPRRRARMPLSTSLDSCAVGVGVGGQWAWGLMESGHGVGGSETVGGLAAWWFAVLQLELACQAGS